MSTFLHLRETLADAISASANFNVPVHDIVKPPKPEMGDFAWGAFSVAKEAKKNPAELAREIANELKTAQLKLVERVEAMGPYVNFFLSTEHLTRDLFMEMDTTGPRYGCLGKDTGEKILFEYSGLNTHKEVHIGHGRNHALGFALTQLWDSQGHSVIPVNFTNDFGMHVAKVVWALMKFHNGNVEAHDGLNRMEVLADMYVEATQKVEEAEVAADESVKKEVSRVLLAIEEDLNSPEHKLWKETREWSLEGFREVYKENGLEFTHWFFESDVKARGKQIVQELVKKGIAQHSQGAIIADLESEGLGIMLLLKSDGTGLYATTDLALFRAKFETFPEVERSIVLTDLRQAQHFQQVFNVLRKDGITKQLEHIGYDFVTLPEGMMSSRKGTVIRYRDLRDALIEKATKEVRTRHEQWPQEKIEQTARAVAFGAMKFTMLTVSSHQKIVFDMDAALAFTGMSATYLQYSYARIQSVRKKVADTRGKLDTTPLSHAAERDVLTHLLWYPDALATAARENDPSVLARYLYELCQYMSTFYEACRIIEEDKTIHVWRSGLLVNVGIVLANGLRMLGIPTVDEL